MPDTPKPYYLTTPIYYVNARPHIGHAYTTIVGDVLARRHRLLGEEVYFLTGTDEHGQKIERSAAAAGIPPQQFTDQVSKTFSDLFARMGITNDQFIRTTSEKHKRGAQHLFSELYKNGHIYLDSYTGQYCVSDETFVDVPVGAPCPDCGRITETVTEENFFFRLSAFQLPLLDLIESGQLAITPDSARNEVLSFIRGDINAATKAAANTTTDVSSRPESAPLADGVERPALSAATIAHSAAGTPYVPGALRDLSVSRSSFTWGIPVPEPAASASTQNHVIYVWLDALANYMTALGYGTKEDGDAGFEAPDSLFNKFWPADLHLVGKEITRFHCVYWPAFLLALNPAYKVPTTDAVILSEARSAQPKDPRILPEPPQLSPQQHREWATKMVPRAITANGWLLFDNAKMSKSKGNVVRTETILEGFGSLCPPPTPTTLDTTPNSLSSRSAAEGSASPEPAPLSPTRADRDLFATDVLRYFLLREIPFGQDGSFSFEAMITRYNADLANGYGNLVSRVLKMIETNYAAYIPEPPRPTLIFRPVTTSDDPNIVFAQGTNDVISLINITQDFYAKSIDGASFALPLANTMSNLSAVDRYISDQAPWKLAKSDESQSKDKLAEVLYTAVEAIRIFTAQFYPILPYTTAKVWQQLGLGDIEAAAASGELNNLEWGGLQPGTKLGPLSPIFPRADKGLAQIMADLEEAPKTQNPEPQTESQTPQPPSTTHPAAGPRTASLTEPGPLTVGGSAAHTTGPDGTPSHTAIAGSGIFASQPAEPTAPAETPQITIDDFAKIELRVAEIKVAERIPKADKLLRLEVDLGPHGSRQILSGIAEHYTPEELIGRRIVVITNLAPRKMRGLESHGMLLAASDEDHGKPHLATCGPDIALGSRLK